MVERVASKRRRVMRSFRISELSAVDSPAQKGATAVLMKRNEQEHDMQKVVRDEPLAFDTLEAAMAHLAEAHGMDPCTAMERAGQMHPGLVKSYNAEGEEVAKALAEANAPRPISKAVADFEKCVRTIMTRDKTTRLGALVKARTEFPDEFNAYQEAP